MRILDNLGQHSGSTQSEESALDMERNACHHHLLPSNAPSPLQPIASGCQHNEGSAAYFSWPTSTLLHGNAEGRANYFGNLQKGVLPGHLGRLPKGKQATTLLDLMTIRAFHSKILRRYSLGTAVGFRIRKGTLTEIPAILVFVARKVHRKWLTQSQCLPAALEVGKSFYFQILMEFFAPGFTYLLVHAMSRVPEMFGVMWMFWNFLIMVHRPQPPKSNCMMNSSMACVVAIRVSVQVLRYLLTLVDLRNLFVCSIGW